MASVILSSGVVVGNQSLVTNGAYTSYDLTKSGSFPSAGYRVASATLTCTLLIYPNPEPGLQDHIVPIWWEFHLWQPEGEVLTDFDWNELAKYLN